MDTEKMKPVCVAADGCGLECSDHCWVLERLAESQRVERPAEAGESGLVERLRNCEVFHRMDGEPVLGACVTDFDLVQEAADTITRLQAELAEARKERDGEKDARRSLSMLAADEVDTAIALRDLLFRARWYVNDALEAHEHSDGRDLLREIDAALPVQALASLSPAKDEESGNG